MPAERNTAKTVKACPCGCGHRPRSAGNKMRPVQCDACGFILRVAHVWMARLDPEAPCPISGCTGRLVPPCLEDLIAMNEDAARKHPAYGKCVAGFTVDAAIRAARKGHYHDPIQCQKCPRFLRHHGALCDCGWQNDIRGDGYYTAAGRADDNVAMPF